MNPDSGAGARAGAGASGVRACLVDVYSTLLRYDFAYHSRRLAELADADVSAWQRAQLALGAAFDSGRLSGSEMLTCLLECCGLSPRPGQIAELERASRDYLRDGCGLFDDSTAFLRELRAAGYKIALVSNCGADTRPVITDLGLVALADEVILSCEIGHAKPGPEIYARALKALGVAPAEAVMIDDQPSYCEGAEAVGVRAIQIAREGTPPDPRFTPAPTLLHIPPLL